MKKIIMTIMLALASSWIIAQSVTYEKVKTDSVQSINGSNPVKMTTGIDLSCSEAAQAYILMIQGDGSTVTRYDTTGLWSGGGGGASTFLDLTDTPSSYAGRAGQYAQVDESEDRLVFAEIGIPATYWDEDVNGYKYPEGDAKVRIGTILTPLYDLEVEDNARIGDSLYVEDLSVEDDAEIGGEINVTGDVNAGGTVSSSDAVNFSYTANWLDGFYSQKVGNDIWFFANNLLTPLLALDGDFQRVGIGIAAPEGELDVGGSIFGEVITARDSLKISGDTNAASYFLVSDGSGAPVTFMDTTGWGGGGGGGATGWTLDTDTTSTDKYVGIGTTNPQYELDVDGDINVTGATRIGGRTDFYSDVYVNNQRVAAVAGTTVALASTTKEVRIGLHNGVQYLSSHKGSHALKVLNSTGGAYWNWTGELRLGDDGTAPTEMLEVAGNALITDTTFFGENGGYIVDKGIGVVELFAGDAVLLHDSTHFEDDITFDPRWEDLRFPATTAKQGNTNKPDFDYTDMVLLYPDDQDSTNELTYHNAQLPHDVDTSQLLYPHIHWIQESSDTVAFRCKWRAWDLGAAATSWVYGSTTSSEEFTYTSGTIHQILSFEAIDLTGYTESTMIQVQIYRVDDGGTGALTGDCKVLEFDIHYARNKMGTTWH